jgi:hypothetical protein
VNTNSEERKILQKVDKDSLCWTTLLQTKYLKRAHLRFHKKGYVLSVNTNS